MVYDEDELQQREVKSQREKQQRKWSGRLAVYVVLV